MKPNYFLIILILVSSLGYSQVDITFKVDMSGSTVSSDGVHVAGSINGWTPDATTLTQEGSTDIYSVTVQLDQGWHYYKFLNGNTWGTEESASYPCAPSNGNRFLYINDSGVPVTLEAVPFNGCNPSGTGLEVTFNVDMSSEGDIAAGSVYMAGFHTDWAPDVLSLPNKDGDIHSGTLRLPTPSDYSVEFQYKYLSAPGWGNEETPAPEDTCNSVTGTDRLVTIDNTGQNVNDVFNGCTFNLSTSNFEADEFKYVYDKYSRKVEILMESPQNISKIQVLNINGQVVDSYNNLGSIDRKIINFNAMANGIYFIRTKSANSVNSKKVIVH